jgi:hypothetical protein
MGSGISITKKKPPHRKQLRTLKENEIQRLLIKESHLLNKLK